MLLYCILIVLYSYYCTCFICVTVGKRVLDDMFVMSMQ